MEEKIRALEKEKAMLLEELAELREVAVLNEKAKALEDEVNTLRMEIKALKAKIPPRLLRELFGVVSSEFPQDYEEDYDECSGCQQEDDML